MLNTSMVFTTNIAACHRCPLRAAPCAGRCVCTKTGRAISLHAAAGDCPLGRHRRSRRAFPLLGDLVESIARVLGIARLAKSWERRTGRSCGCAARKEKLNALTMRLLKKNR